MAGFEGEALTAAAAVPRLNAALAEFRQQAGPSWEREKDKPRKARYNYFRVMSMHMCRLSHVLRKMFADDASLYFTKGGLNTTKGLDCEWTLGAWKEKCV